MSLKKPASAFIIYFDLKTVKSRIIQLRTLQLALTVLGPRETTHHCME